MSVPTIRTNNVPRDILYPWDLSLAELADFDYLIDAPDDATAEQLQELWCDSGAQFFRYRGELYDLSEFVRIVPLSQQYGFEHGVSEDSPLLKWQGIRTDSYFSALVVRYANDDESLVVGLYLC